MTNANDNASNQSQDEAGALSGQCPMQPLGVDIVPVRYAIDEEDDDGDGKFGLPEQWQGNGIFQRNLIESDYTLRQLRDGWLYVIADYDKTFHEYEVKGSDFIKYNLESWVKEKGKTDRGAPGSQSPFLTYHQKNTLYIAWSKERWSWRLFNFVLENKSNSKSWMRRVSLNQYCRTLQASHAGEAEKIAEAVADISESASDALLFEGHMAQTAESQTTETEDESTQTEIKPVITKGTVTGAMADVKSALFVALDDPYTDLQDLSLALTRELFVLEALNDEKGHKHALLETTAQVIGLNTPKDTQYPTSIKTLKEKKQYHQLLSEYYNTKKAVQDHSDILIRDKQSLIDDGSYNYHLSHHERLKGKLTAQQDNLKQKYRGIEPNNEDNFKRWKDTKKWRDEINEDALITDIDEYAQNDLPILEAQAKRVERYRSQLQAACRTFGWHPERGFVDNETREGQDFLSEINYFLIESMSKALDDKAVEWLKNEFDSPKTLMPLYLSGYSKALYQAIQEELPEPRIYLTGNDYDDAANTLTAIDDFLSNKTIQDTKFFKDLKAPLQNVLTVFSESVKVISEGAISSIAHKSSSLLILANNHNFIRFNIIAEKVALNTNLRTNPHYADEIKKWSAQYNAASQELRYLELEAQHLKASRMHDISIAGMDDSIDSEHIETQKRKMTDLQRAAQAKLSDLNDIYYDNPSVFYLAKDNIDDLSKDFRLDIKNKIKMGVAITSNSYNRLGGFGFMVFLLNVYDLKLAFSSMQAKRVVSERERVEILQKIGYSLSAFASIFQSKAWGEIDNKIHEKFKKKTLSVVIKSSSTSITKYLKLTGVISILSLLAIGSEIYYTFYDTVKSTGAEKWLNGIKLASLGGMAFTSTLQLGVILFPSYFTLGFFTLPALIAFGAILGIAYIITTILLNILKKDDYQKWLIQTPWGSKPNTNWTIENSDGVINALLALYKITLQPKLTAKTQTTIIPSRLYHSAVDRQVTGFTLKLELSHEIDPEYVAIKFIQPQSIQSGQGVWEKLKDPTNQKTNIRTYTLNANFSKNNQNFDIEVSLPPTQNRNSSLYKKVIYRYVFDYSMFSHIETTIPALNDDDLDIHLEDIQKQKNMDYCLLFHGKPIENHFFTNEKHCLIL
ncbi:T6SS effector BTH_I2691 family protein [Photobacterium swingsii]|uniref:T6SS effector BTH_I2691 family protein n=2 Tax=Photobacterium swingsii TaxID=680026 RepID=UPI003D1173E9